MSRLEFKWTPHMVHKDSIFKGDLLETDDFGNTQALRNIELWCYWTPEYQEHDRVFNFPLNPRTHCYRVVIYEHNYHGHDIHVFDVDPVASEPKHWCVGTPIHTIDEMKTWCEQYVASCYIKEYEARMQRIKQLESITNQLRSMGFTGNVENYGEKRSKY